RTCPTRSRPRSSAKRPPSPCAPSRGCARWTASSSRSTSSSASSRRRSRRGCASASAPCTRASTSSSPASRGASVAPPSQRERGSASSRGLGLRSSLRPAQPFLHLRFFQRGGSERVRQELREGRGALVAALREQVDDHVLRELAEDLPAD